MTPCVCCRKNPCECRAIVCPVHPDDKDVPLSVIYFPLSGRRYVRITVPLAYKTMDILEHVLVACKPALVSQPVEDDYEI
jgi:hypothetical protein